MLHSANLAALLLALITPSISGSATHPPAKHHRSSAAKTIRHPPPPKHHELPATEAEKSKDNADSRIIDFFNPTGSDAPINRYPYTVFVSAEVGGGGRPSCAGTLISPNIVLTAAHCYFFNALHHESVTVVVNPHTLNHPITESETFGVLRTFIHPLYEIAAPSLLEHHDYMLLQLDGASAQRPVKLNIDSNLSLDDSGLLDLQLLGWGEASDGGDNPLQEVGVLPFGNTQCKEYPGYESQFCSTNSGTIYCGNGGAPLIIPGSDNSGDIQVGLVARNIQCHEPENHCKYCLELLL